MKQRSCFGSSFASHYAGYAATQPLNCDFQFYEKISYVQTTASPGFFMGGGKDNKGNKFGSGH